MSYIIEINDGIAMFTINRPEMRNAVNSEVMDGLEKFLNEVETNDSLSFAVITGKGDRAFCSGGDLSEFHSLRTAEEALPMLSRMAGLLYRLSTLHVPVIALVNGAAVGGGCEIATACDYRIVSTTAKAGFIQGKLAITSGWGGATQLFLKMERRDAAMKMLSEARIHTADELKSIGWASTLYDENYETGLLEFVKQMKSVHPSVHRAYKKIAVRHWKSAEIRGQMLEEAEQCAQLWQSEAHHEAVENFLKKNK